MYRQHEPCRCEPAGPVNADMESDTPGALEALQPIEADHAPPPTLRFAERWILSNQYRILQQIEPEPDPNYEIYIQILENGYRSLYGIAAQYVRQDEFPNDIAEEVEGILTMFSHLQWAKEKLQDRTITEHPRYEFWGFDGNNSPHHLQYAGILHSLHRFPDLGDLLLINSHSNTIDIYRAMVKQWRQLSRKGIRMRDEDVRIVLLPDH